LESIDQLLVQRDRFGIGLPGWRFLKLRSQPAIIGTNAGSPLV
jgi:hypothetical protein